MARQVVGITLDNLSDLPDACRSCAFWELSPAARTSAARSGTEALDKEAWVSDTLLEWGNCGQLAYVDGVPAGFVLYAPAAYVPRAEAFATSPVGADALLLMTGRVLPAYAHRGIGRVLVQTAAREAARRNVRALEAFGQAADQPSADANLSTGCLLPSAFLLAVGFRTIRPHRSTPRLRLDIRSTASWREDVESAFERILGTIQSPIASR